MVLVTSPNEVEYITIWLLENLILSKYIISYWLKFNLKSTIYNTYKKILLFHLLLYLPPGIESILQNWICALRFRNKRTRL